jgi:hypothetical protein
MFLGRSAEDKLCRLLPVPAGTACHSLAPVR